MMRRTRPLFTLALFLAFGLSGQALYSQDIERLEELTGEISAVWQEGALDMEYAGDSCSKKGLAVEQWAMRVSDKLGKLNNEMNDILGELDPDETKKYSLTLREGMNPFFDQVTNCYRNAEFSKRYEKAWTHFSADGVNETEK